MCFDLSKFPSILRKGFLENNISFPEKTEFEYEPIFAYRKISRTDFQNCKLNKDDFKSYAELGKRPRGIGENNWSYYSCSLNCNLKEIENIFKFPGKTKGIAAGYVKKEYGVKLGPDSSDNHIDWWLYEDAEPENDFKFLKGGL